MIRNKPLYIRALQLRRKEKSYRYINTKLGISKGTLYSWFSNKKWSQRIHAKIHRKSLAQNWILFKKYVRKQKRERQRLYVLKRKEAKIEFEYFVHDPLFVAGVSLYWGEGDKVGTSNIRLTNTDPTMIDLFRRFLERYSQMPHEKIRIGLILYPDCKNEDCRLFWSRRVHIPLSQFTKSVVIQGRHPTKRLAKGIGMITICNRVFKEKLLTWIKLIPKLKNTRV